MTDTDRARFRSRLMIAVLVSVSLGVTTLGQAAPIRQGANAEASCETVSAGQYYCKIDGKCYYCDTKTNPDPNKNCRSTKCDAAMMNPGLKGAVRPQFGARAPIMRRGVDPEAPPAAPQGPTDPKLPPIEPGGTGPTTPK